MSPMPCRATRTEAIVSGTEIEKGGQGMCELENRFLARISRVELT